MKNLDELMNVNKWEQLRVNNPEEYKRMYCAFMYNPECVGCCAICPENNGQDGGAGHVAGPCGQQHCWVAIHCERSSFYDEEDDEEYDSDSPFSPAERLERLMRNRRRKMHE